jgi:ABC-type dipeptide/oligopeptide/nickel transport system permease component
MVQAVVMMFTLVFVVANLFADLLNSWVNPRFAMSPV